MASLHTSQNAPDVFTGLTASMGVAGTRDMTSYQERFYRNQRSCRLSQGP